MWVCARVAAGVLHAGVAAASSPLSVALLLLMVAQLGGMVIIAFQHGFDLGTEHKIACLID